jgi:hypothetical protein
MAEALPKCGNRCSDHTFAQCTANRMCKGVRASAAIYVDIDPRENVHHVPAIKRWGFRLFGRKADRLILPMLRYVVRSVQAHLRGVRGPEPCTIR